MQSAYKFDLDNYCMVVDRNGLQLDGPTKEIMPIYNLPEIIKNFGWYVQEIDGHSIQELFSAFNNAKSRKGCPSCIIANTVKGKGVSFMENKLEWHGRAPSKEEYEEAVKEIMEGARQC